MFLKEIPGKKLDATFFERVYVLSDVHDDSSSVSSCVCPVCVFQVQKMTRQVYRAVYVQHVYSSFRQCLVKCIKLYMFSVVLGSDNDSSSVSSCVCPACVFQVQTMTRQVYPAVYV